VGDINIKDAITKEVAIISYDYNNEQPRVFSKFAAGYAPGYYDVKIKDATEGSASAPIYFSPKVLGT